MARSLLHCVVLDSFGRQTQLLEDAVRGDRIRIRRAASIEQARQLLGRGGARVLLAPAALSDEWRRALELAASHDPPIALVAMLARFDPDLWAKVLCCGAYDALPMPFRREEVRRMLSGAADYARRAALRRPRLTARPVAGKLIDSGDGFERSEGP